MKVKTALRIHLDPVNMIKMMQEEEETEDEKEKEEGAGMGVRKGKYLFIASVS